MTSLASSARPIYRRSGLNRTSHENLIEQAETEHSTSTWMIIPNLKRKTAIIAPSVRIREAIFNDLTTGGVHSDAKPWISWS